MKSDFSRMLALRQAECARRRKVKVLQLLLLLAVLLSLAAVLVTVLR